MAEPHADPRQKRRKNKPTKVKPGTCKRFCTTNLCELNQKCRKRISQIEQTLLGGRILGNTVEASLGVRITTKQRLIPAKRSKAKHAKTVVSIKRAGFALFYLESVEPVRLDSAR